MGAWVDEVRWWIGRWMGGIFQLICETKAKEIFSKLTSPPLESEC